MGISDKLTQVLLYDPKMSHADIAAHIGISERGVKDRVKRVATALNVSTRQEAIIYALRDGLIRIDDIAFQENSCKR